MDNCKHCQITLEKENCGVIDPKDHEEAHQHLKTCKVCQKYAGSIKEINLLFKIEFAPSKEDDYWKKISKRIKWATKRPLRELSFTFLLIIGSVIFGFFDIIGWFFALGFILAIPRGRIKAWIEHKNEIRKLADSSAELLNLYSNEIDRLSQKSLFDFIVYSSLGLFFILLSFVSNSPISSLIVSAIMWILACYNIMIMRPYSRRLRNELAE